MKRFLSGMRGVVLLVFFITSGVQAQNEYWFFGQNGAGMDFSNGNAVQNNGLPSINFNESVTVVSDGSGNLLFYSDGMEVYDKNHLLMPSGTIVGSGGSSAAQGAISISHPNNPNRFYIFTADDSDDALDHGIRWHEIDITIPGNGTVLNPSGDVISADNVVVGSSAEMLTAFGCGDTIWVVGHGKNNADFYAIPVTGLGPQAPIVSTIGVLMNGPQLRGSLAFNSTGTKLVCTNGNGNARILDFNPITGVLSNAVVISGSFYGSEWSSTDNVIYLTAATGANGLFHYNVASQVLTLIDDAHLYGEIVTARDGNLYVGKWVGEQDSSLAVITSPNSLIPTDVGIGFKKDGWFANRTVAFGLPQNLACPIIICPDTTTTQPSNLCVGFTEDLTTHIVGDTGSWSVTQAPVGSNPAVITGGVFDASNMETDPGIYTLTFKADVFHPTCDSVTTRKIVVYPKVEVDLGSDTAICADYSVSFDAGNGVDWLWNTGETSQVITKDAVGTYSVIVTDSNNCVGRDTISLLINKLPVVNLGNDTAICSDSTIVFDAQVGVSWIWDNGSTSQSIVTNVGGDYSVIVTDFNGCIGLDTITLQINSLPIVDLGNDTSICADSTIALDAQIGAEWLWNTSSINQSITANVTGDYSVMVTDLNGCVGYDTVALLMNASPIVDLGNDTSICVDQSIVFDAVIGVGWMWNTGDVTESIVTNTGGQYDVTVVDLNGCVGYDTIVLTTHDLPIVDLGNDTAICVDSLVEFTANVGVQWIWDSGESTQMISTNAAGDHSVIVTDVNGCVNYDTITLTIHNLPIVDLGSDTAICMDSAVVFKANIGVGWLWNTGAITDFVSANSTGDYSVIVVDSNGCVGYDTISLNMQSLPVVTLGNDTSICVDSIVVFKANVGVYWQWNTGAITDQITVYTADEYDVVVTDSNGCVGYDTIVLSINELPIVDLGNDTAICADSSIVFDAVLGNTWLWNTGAISSDITVNLAGDYDVVVQDSNGCVNYDTVSLLIHALPVVELGNDTSICSDSSIVFKTTIGMMWNWNNGAGTSYISANKAGDYDVIVTDSNGCVGYDTIRLTINSLPVVDLGRDSSLCRGDEMVIYAGLNDVKYHWNPTLETIDSIIVTIENDYSLTVIDSNNCVGYDTISISVDELPIVSLGEDSSLCEGDSMILKAGKSGGVYLWSTGEVSEEIKVKLPSEYIVTVTNAALCSSSDTVLVTVDTVPVVDLGNDTAICDQEKIILDAENEGDNIQWNTGSSSQIVGVDQAGTYNVTVTNSFSCSTSDTLTLSILKLPVIDLIDDQLVCDFRSIEATVKENDALYFWSTGETSQSIVITKEGHYYVQVIDSNNCFNKDTVIITKGPDLDVNLHIVPFICFGDAVETNLTVDNEAGELTYLWNTGATESKIEIDSSGLYSVLVIDTLGCWGRDSNEVVEMEIPTISLSADSLSMCSVEAAKESVLITASHTGSYVEWGTGEVGDLYQTEVSGFFEAVVYDSIGCSNYDSLTIAEYCRPISITLPNIFTPNGDGLNDQLFPIETVWEDHQYMMHYVEKISFEVLNRWGEAVFTSEGVLPHWNGVHTKGVEVPSGTYFWILQYTDIDGVLYKTNGFVELVR